MFGKFENLTNFRVASGMKITPENLNNNKEENNISIIISNDRLTETDEGNLYAKLPVIGKTYIGKNDVTIYVRSSAGVKIIMLIVRKQDVKKIYDDSIEIVIPPHMITPWEKDPSKFSVLTFIKGCSTY